VVGENVNVDSHPTSPPLKGGGKDVNSLIEGGGRASQARGLGAAAPRRRRAKQIRRISASSYLDDPQDVISIDAIFEDLPDGTDYLSLMTVPSEQKKLKITVATMNYTLINPYA
jgi:hypothetical protein